MAANSENSGGRVALSGINICTTTTKIEESFFEVVL